MEYVYELSNLQEYNLNNVSQYVEMLIYTTVSFFLPIILGHQQLVVGIAVNCLLITAALNLKGYKLLPVILAPSLGALSAGLIFGPFTIFLFYMIPFIWIGNSILVFSFKHFKLQLKKNYLMTLIIGAGAKSLFLFGCAFILFELGIIPVMFLTAMGIIQLITALGGGVAAYGLQNIKKRFAV
jgi:hypothetical protein